MQGIIPELKDELALSLRYPRARHSWRGMAGHTRTKDRQGVNVRDPEGGHGLIHSP